MDATARMTSKGQVTVPKAVRDASSLAEGDRLDVADAYLVACAERMGVGVVVSFDRSIDHVGTVRREEPA